MNCVGDITPISLPIAANATRLMFMSPEETLMPLGFTETEALAYCELQRAGPSTGYRIAQGIGKAQANTYKALSTLVQKAPSSMTAASPARFVRWLRIS